MKLTISLLLGVFCGKLVRAGSIVKVGSVCTVHAGGEGSDDAPAIISALQQCQQDSTVVFEDDTYHIESVMETTGLKNVTIDHRGTLLWGTNITYWRNASLPLGYQNQSTAWKFGGTDITWNGHGFGTFDGNGQLWYNFAQNVSNVAGRPIALTITNTSNSIFTGIRFVQSQFWTMAITYSNNLLLEDIYVNSTSNTNTSTLNTDGCDTFYSDNITFRRWSITNGDDSISPKANSTNILVQDSIFYNGNGVAIGSIGQYNDTFEFIQNVTAERITAVNTLWAGYIKTWTGVVVGIPPNGGGGGIGFAKNITFRDFTVVDLVGGITEITQCISYSGATGNCDTSTFQISDYVVGPIYGSIQYGSLANVWCSASAPCPGVEFIGFDRVRTNGTRDLTCSNVVDPNFNCTGPAIESSV